MLIIGAALFTIIPDKGIWLWLTIAGLILGAIAMGLLLPHKEEDITKYTKEKDL